jgi:hypothetical protein
MTLNLLVFVADSVLQVNNTLIELNLRSNVLGSQGVTAIAKSLMVALHFAAAKKQQNRDTCLRFSQANKTLTNLNLEDNRVGPRGGKAIAESLKVWCFCRHDST